MVIVPEHGGSVGGTSTSLARVTNDNDDDNNNNNKGNVEHHDTMYSKNSHPTQPAQGAEEQEELVFLRTEPICLPLEIDLTKDDIESMQTYQSKRRIRDSSKLRSFSVSPPVDVPDKRRAESSPSSVMLSPAASTKTVFSRNSISKLLFPPVQKDKEGGRLGRRWFGRNRGSRSKQSSSPRRDNESVSIDKKSTKRRDDESASIDNKSRKSQQSNETEPTEETSISVLHQIQHLTSTAVSKTRALGKPSVVDQTPNRFGEEASVRTPFSRSGSTSPRSTLVRSPCSLGAYDSEHQIHQRLGMLGRPRSEQRRTAASPTDPKKYPSPSPFTTSRSDVNKDTSTAMNETSKIKFGRIASS
eukprot:scaffold16119_cov162-Amphora_coffeaeformis.AAC.1